MAGFTRRNVRLRDLSSYLWKVACIAGMKRGIEGGRAGMEAGGGRSPPLPLPRLRLQRVWEPLGT